MMAHYQNPDNIADDSKKEMIREPSQIYPPNVTLSNCKGFGSFNRLHHEVAQLRVKLVGKFRTSCVLVVLHDGLDVRVNPRMENEPHQFPRRLIF